MKDFLREKFNEEGFCKSAITHFFDDLKNVALPKDDFHLASTAEEMRFMRGLFEEGIIKFGHPPKEQE